MEKINNSKSEILPWVSLTNDEIEKFKKVYKKKFDIILTDKEALDYWIALVSFMKASLSKK